MFALTEYVSRMLRTGRTANILIYGEPRIGKSVYIIKSAKELYKDWQPPPALAPYLEFTGEDVWRNFIVFRPEQFVKLISVLLITGSKVPLIVWDDAGLWLFALDWNDPRIKAVLKMLQVSGVVTAGLVFTTPAVSMILKKILNIEGILVGKVVKAEKNREHQRKAKVYKNSLTAWGKRYVKQRIEDDFDVMLNQRDYDWYAPIRMTYLRDALQALSRAYGIPIADIETAHALMQSRAAEQVVEPTA